MQAQQARRDDADNGADDKSSSRPHCGPALEVLVKEREPCVAQDGGGEKLDGCEAPEREAWRAQPEREGRSYECREHRGTPVSDSGGTGQTLCQTRAQLIPPRG